MTELKYLTNSYLFQDNAKITNIDTDEYGTFIILDSTIFYPQGGGQPSDKGYITAQNSSNSEAAEFEVVKCIFDGEDVRHYGMFTSGSLEVGESVNLSIDQELRITHIKYHSAGHFIDYAIGQLKPDWQCTKGHCFPNGAYMEYIGEYDNSEAIRAAIEDKVNEIIQSKPTIDFKLVEDVKHLSGKPQRIMKIEGYPDMPCGGTHVSSSEQIGKVTIRKIKKTGETFRVSYSVDTVLS
jgi:Ser-tRNA(Ala) deacylase AlaX